MHIEALKHMAGIVRAISSEGRIIVYGSSSIFGTIPRADSEITESKWVVRSHDCLREVAEKGGKPLPR